MLVVVELRVPETASGHFLRVLHPELSHVQLLLSVLACPWSELLHLILGLERQLGERKVVLLLRMSLLLQLLVLSQNMIGLQAVGLNLIGTARELLITHLKSTLQLAII